MARLSFFAFNLSAQLSPVQMGLGSLIVDISSSLPTHPPVCPSARNSSEIAGNLENVEDDLQGR